MNVILLEKIRNLGELGSQVKVKAGFGRNYLIPQGKAVPANKANTEKFEAMRAELEKKAAEVLQAAQQRAEKLAAIKLTIAARAGEEGKLFGSVGPSDLMDAIAAAGGEIDKSELRLPEGPIRELGEFDVELHLHSEVIATINVNVVAEE